MIKLTIESTIKKDTYRYHMAFRPAILKERRGVKKVIMNIIVPFLFKSLESVSKR